jgi:hypothetical protein
MISTINAMNEELDFVQYFDAMKTLPPTHEFILAVFQFCFV